MHWECGECGHLLRHQREEPRVCGACGIAGTFVRADGAAEEPDPGWFGAAWERLAPDEVLAEGDR